MLIEGFVEHLGPRAEVVLFVDGKTERFFMPRDGLDRLGIVDGGGFWYDPATGAVQALNPVPVEWPEKYDSPDELSAKAGRGP